MQNQINTNPESPDTVTIHAATPQFIIGPGGVVNLTGLVPSTSTNTSDMTGIQMYRVLQMVQFIRALKG